MTVDLTPPAAADRSAEVAAALRVSFVPEFARELAAVPGFLDYAWPVLHPSVDTAGFLGSALYMADMALDAVEEVYDEPQVSPATLVASGVGPEELDQLLDVVDVFHWLHPQLLLLAAALAEAFERGRVGGQGRPEERPLSEREAAHLATVVGLIPEDVPPLPEIAEALQLEHAPELYRAVAAWPGSLLPAWEELQHLSAYPEFRRRGRALYYYARSGARFLARPLDLRPETLDAAGVTPEAAAQARRAVDDALPALATMMMHTCAMRVSLGVRDREVVQD